MNTVNDLKELLTIRVLRELVGHEAIVLEAYKDSKGIWTWGIGVTAASGHDVMRYKDNPQTVEKVLSVFEWLVRERYAPAVLREFDGFKLTEAQFCAALSFHYNTGAISRASWPDIFRAGNKEKARNRFMQWDDPPEIIGRRSLEAKLFFDGDWSCNGVVSVVPVNKASYKPRFSKAQRVNIDAALEAVIAKREL